MNTPRIWFAAFIVLVLAASVDARELPLSSPADVGLSAERLGRLGAGIERALEQQRVAGVVALVARHGEIAYLASFGMADHAGGREMRTDDLFRIASMTKPVTSVAAMILVEEGRLGLDDPVAKYLPEFDREMSVVVPADDGWDEVPAERPITIRHLLTHTSGIAYRFMGQEPLSDMLAEAGVTDGLDSEMSTAELIERLAALPLAHQPGEGWTYGLNTDVLGRVIEVVSGMPLGRFFETRLFTPLGMTDTGFDVGDDKRRRLARVYRANAAGVLEPVPAGLIEDGPAVYSVDYPYAGIRRHSGGGGLVSTARDYARFMQMMLNGGELDGVRILGRKTVELMLTDHTSRIGVESFGGLDFGLGFSIDHGPAATGNIGSPGVAGWDGFFNTRAFIDPEEDLVAVPMIQHYPYGVELMDRFRTLVYQAIVD